MIVCVGETLTAAEPRQLMEQAIDRLSRYQSISARLRQRIDLFGQQLVGSGTYEQGPPRAYQLRMELTVPMGGRMTSYQQISDGRTLWLVEQVLEEPAVRRVDLARVVSAWEASPRSLMPSRLPDMLVVGGLPKMLRAINDWCQFTAAQPHQLSGLPVWVVRGRLDPKRLAHIEEDSMTAPRPIPDEVVVVLGQQDLFPYRFEYRRVRPAEKSSPHGALMVALELFDVRTGVSFDPQRFRYSPGSAPTADVTLEMIQRLGLVEIDRRLQQDRGVTAEDERRR